MVNPCHIQVHVIELFSKHRNGSIRGLQVGLCQQVHQGSGRGKHVSRDHLGNPRLVGLYKG